MASTRLPSLWSAVCRNSEIYSPALRSARATQRIQAYHPTRRFQQQESIPQRYGTANEPPPHLADKKAGDQSTKQQQQPEKVKSQPKIGEKMQQQQDEVKEVKSEDSKADSNNSKSKTEPTTTDSDPATISTPTTDPMLDSTSGAPQRSASNPLDSILASVPDPQQHEQEDGHAEEHADKSFDEHAPLVKAPHIEQPRYIHHFDTYGLVKRLKDSGWDGEQAITVMKAMRVILGDKTDLAKEALVSKSNLENEAYLFKAACAELRTEVMARRKSEQEKMRTERTQLQHEVDIISQRLGQESSNLKDELKGLFDDRKMAVRNEQRDMESKIQQLNYRITVELQADGKSEVEGLRWIMTRRVIMTLGIVVLMIVGSLKITANAFASEEGAKGAKGSAGSSSASAGTQTEFAGESGSGKAAGGGGGGREGSTGAGYESLG